MSPAELWPGDDRRGFLVARRLERFPGLRATQKRQARESAERRASFPDECTSPVDGQYIEWEAARWRSIDPLRWQELPRKVRAEVVAHWIEHGLREAEAHWAAKRKADREARARK